MRPALCGKRFALIFSLLLLASFSAHSQSIPLTDTDPQASASPSPTLEQSLNQLDEIWNQLEAEGMDYSEKSQALKTALESAQAKSKELLLKLESSETQAKELSYSLEQVSKSLELSVNSLQEANKEALLSNATSSIWKVAAIASASALVGEIIAGPKGAISLGVAGMVVTVALQFKDFIHIFEGKS